jgi:dTDP-4-dehydrorhamnose 3,5-epimerase
MTFTPLQINGVWLNTPIIRSDERGSFHEVFKLSQIGEQLGREFQVQQVNQSTSRKGVLRGIHVTKNLRGQAKYVSCVRGALLDLVVDLRLTSDTYGMHETRILSEENQHSLLISEGIGHGFLALSENTVANYLCSSEYSPSDDRIIDAYDKDLAINFQDYAERFDITEIQRSEKDALGLSLQVWGSGEGRLSDAT